MDACRKVLLESHVSFGQVCSGAMTSGIRMNSRCWIGCRYSAVGARWTRLSPLIEKSLVRRKNMPFGEIRLEILESIAGLGRDHGSTEW